MLVSRHVFIGLCFSILFGILVNLHPVFVMLMFFGTFIIDFDHYLIYAWKKKDWNPKNAYLFFMNWDNKENKAVLCIFHTFEFFVVMIIISLVYVWLVFFIMGVLVHLVLDVINMYTYDERREFSIVIYILKKMKYPNRYL